MRTVVAGIVLLLAATFVVLACSPSGVGAEACDFGGGGLTDKVCASYAEAGACGSGTLMQQTQSPCADPTVVVTVNCCMLANCTGDLGFLATPDAAFRFPLPSCEGGPETGDGGASGDGGGITDAGDAGHPTDAGHAGDARHD